MKKISVIGSTGSIGTNTIDVVRHFPDRFKVLALAAGKNVGLLAKQIREFSPKVVAVLGQKERRELQEEVGDRSLNILIGREGLKEAASLTDSDLIVIAISGSSGLLPTYWAVNSGHDIALANKESLVMAGKIITSLAKKKGVNILPVDSEHSAIFQCLQGRKREEVFQIILTASGGPFRDYTIRQMKDLTPEMAMDHPVWRMGKKVTIDSSTMMNKGLEVIEARWLFDFPPEMIKVIVHPESVIHSMVEFIDRSVIALLSLPDMRLSIMKALGYPDTLGSDLFCMDLVNIGRLTFFAPDEERFPCLRLAYQALEGEESLTVALNASNEVAVEAFYNKIIGYTDIPEIIKMCMEKHKPKPISSIEDALEVDRLVKEMAEKIIKGEQL
ncbi:1-deoxy-D-xylulose-5-phosphate reductoisomerase [bacterium]|nr:1-deoxy-D-xylulose-5-phosphate reductoisomerase [bacterium]